MTEARRTYIRPSISAVAGLCERAAGTMGGESYC